MWLDDVPAALLSGTSHASFLIVFNIFGRMVQDAVLLCPCQPRPYQVHPVFLLESLAQPSVPFLLLQGL